MSRFSTCCTLSLVLALPTANLWAQQQPQLRQQTGLQQQQAPAQAAAALNVATQPGVTQPGTAQPGTAQADGEVRIPIVGAAAAIEAGLARAPAQQPFPPLTPSEQQFLDQVLMVWEKRTADVKQFQCDFRKWEFNPTQHATAPISIASGIIKFSKPDKGLFRVDELKSMTGDPANPYQVNPRRKEGDYWICDGNWIHNLDRNEKKAVRTQLPPQMQGELIHRSPLPFLFGVNAEEIKQRYFVHVVKPPEGNDDVWIEAWPKRSDDAGNYSRVQVVLDRTDVLPKSMILFLPNWTPEKKHREVYEFTNREVMDGLLDKAKQLFFMKEFISTKLDSDWQVIEEPWLPAEESMPPPSQQQPQQSQLRATAPNQVPLR